MCFIQLLVIFWLFYSLFKFKIFFHQRYIVPTLKFILAKTWKVKWNAYCYFNNHLLLWYIFLVDFQIDLKVFFDHFRSLLTPSK